MPTETAHLAGETVSPHGPHLILTRSVPAGAEIFYTNIVGGLRLGEPYSVVIEFGKAQAEVVSVVYEGDEGLEMRWRVR